MTKGPIEERAWPTQLQARVVNREEGDATVFGYRLETDLATHYNFSELTFLALTGSCPTREQAADFSVAMMWLATISPAEAPTHAGILSRTFGAEASRTLALVATVLTDEARHALTEIGDLLAFFHDPGEAAFPPRFQSDDPNARASVARLSAHVTASVPTLAQRPSRLAATLSILHHCGIHSVESLTTAWTLARLPLAMAECIATPLMSMKDYPITTPEFEYTPPGDPEPSE